ncbi:MAG: amidase family protein [Actinomycetota bacterium]|nr:amidase family protein [Actinomycetota bacterium]
MGVIGATASEISEEVRAGRWTAEAVVGEHLDFIHSKDRHWGAFRVIRADAALTEARALDAAPGMRDLPLAGVPIAIKDNVAVCGEVTTHGSAAVTSWTPASADHPVVARLRAAGAIVVGLTRVPELCLFAFTDAPGAVTRNPWDPARTSGGSSGGSAAAVAAGMVPIAHGADGLGSLRIPAACCGLVTLKAGRGTVPAGLGVGDWYGMAENGILATTVQDLALGHGVLAGTPTPDPSTGGADELRIGTSVASPLAGTRADCDNRSGVDRAAAALAVRGHRVSPVRVPYPTSAALTVVLRWYAVAAADAAAIGADLDRLQRRTRRHAQLGRLVTRLRLVRPGPVRAFRQRLRVLFRHMDVLITPVLTGTPLPAEEWHRRGWVANVLAASRFAPYPAVWNLAGYPAMSVPVGTRSDGLPLAVQIVGPPGSEAGLLGIAATLEAELPWQRHAVSLPVQPSPG